MARDPRRIVNQSGPPLERELLQSLRGIVPPVDARSNGWQALAQTIAVTGIATSPDNPTNSATALSKGSAAPPLATPGVGLSALKVLAGVVFVGGAAGTLSWLALSGQPNPGSLRAAASVSPPLVVTSQPTPRAETPTPTPTPAVFSPPPPAAAAQTTAVQPQTAIKAGYRDELARESALLVAARAKLRQGNTAGAHTVLRQLDQMMPAGKLMQEREVLRIELLAAKGDRNGAARRAQAFLAAHPNSPHAPRLARFIE